MRILVGISVIGVVIFLASYFVANSKPWKDDLSGRYVEVFEGDLPSRRETIRWFAREPAPQRAYLRVTWASDDLLRFFLTEKHTAEEGASWVAFATVLQENTAVFKVHSGFQRAADAESEWIECSLSVWHPRDEDEPWAKLTFGDRTFVKILD